MEFQQITIILGLLLVNGIVFLIWLRKKQTLNKRGKTIVHEGLLNGRLPYISMGDGPVLVIFRTLMPTNENPKGVSRWAELRMLKPLAESFTVYSVSRPPGIKQGATMSDFTAEYAMAIENEFGSAVNIMGVSTGGSIAQQFATEYPHLVKKLVIAGTAYKLGSIGKQVQQRYAHLLADGQYRESTRSLSPIVADSHLGQIIMGWLMWLTEPFGRSDDPSDMIKTLVAEDHYNIEQGLNRISAPTLVIGGSNDVVYPLELVEHTAELIPNSHLKIYSKCGHRDVFTDSRFNHDVLSFLLE